MAIEWRLFLDHIRTLVFMDFNMHIHGPYRHINVPCFESNKKFLTSFWKIYLFFFVVKRMRKDRRWSQRASSARYNQITSFLFFLLLLFDAQGTNMGTTWRAR